MKKIIGGLVFLLVGVITLWWNEGNFVKEAKKLSEGKELVTEGDITRVDPTNNGKLIFLNGTVTTEEQLTFDDFNISENAIKLKYTSEIYQYKEKKHKNEDINYEELWSENLINSDKFVNEVKKNPKIKKYDSSEIQAKKVNINDFELNEQLIRKIQDWQPVSINNGIHIIGVDTFKIIDNTFFLSENPQVPKVGDIKLNFEVVFPNKEVSLVAQQKENSFAPFQTTNGRTIQELKMGNYTSISFFAALDQQNSNMNWAFRFGGFFMLFLAFKMMFSPLVRMGKSIPFLGKIVGMGTSLIAAILAGGISFIVISISWVFYRPLIGIGLLAVGVGAIYYLRRKSMVSEDEQ